VTRTTNLLAHSPTIQPIPAVPALPLIIHPVEPVPIIVKDALRHIHHLRQHNTRHHPVHTPAVSALTAVPDSASAPCIQDAGG
jgi:hypothetical protein